jgi:hypothetical protein
LEAVADCPFKVHVIDGVWLRKIDVLQLLNVMPGEKKVVWPRSSGGGLIKLLEPMGIKSPAESAFAYPNVTDNSFAPSLNVTQSTNGVTVCATATFNNNEKKLNRSRMRFMRHLFV